MVNGVRVGRGGTRLKNAGRRGPLSKDSAQALAGGTRTIRSVHVAQSLRRIRTELSLLLANVDDGLRRIEANDQSSQAGNLDNGAAS